MGRLLKDLRRRGSGPYQECSKSRHWRRKSLPSSLGVKGMQQNTLPKRSEIVLLHIAFDLIFTCSGDCTVGLWSQWTRCTKTCDGRQERSRRIANPKIGEGKDCPVLRQWTKCSSNSCPGPTTALIIDLLMLSQIDMTEAKK